MEDTRIVGATPGDVGMTRLVGETRESGSSGAVNLETGEDPDDPYMLGGGTIRITDPTVARTVITRIPTTRTGVNIRDMETDHHTEGLPVSTVGKGKHGAAGAKSLIPGIYPKVCSK